MQFHFQVPIKKKKLYILRRGLIKEKEQPNFEKGNLPPNPIYWKLRSCCLPCLFLFPFPLNYRLLQMQTQGFSQWRRQVFKLIYSILVKVALHRFTCEPSPIPLQSLWASPLGCLAIHTSLDEFSEAQKRNNLMEPRCPQLCQSLPPSFCALQPQLPNPTKP